MSTASQAIALAKAKLSSFTSPENPQRKWALFLLEALQALEQHTPFLDEEVNSGLHSLVDFLSRLASPSTRAGALASIDTMSVDQIIEAQKHSNERVREFAKRAEERRAQWQGIISDLGAVGLRVAVAALLMA